MAFEQDLLELLPRLRRFARSLARTPDDADDLCQSAIERAIRSRSQWQAGTRLDSWMFKIMRNLWIDTARAAARRGTEVSIEDNALDIPDDSHRRIEARAALNDVDRAMSRLPAEQREAIALVLVEGLSYKDAADVLGVPAGTLTSRLVRGRAALLEELGEAA